MVWHRLAELPGPCADAASAGHWESRGMTSSFGPVGQTASSSASPSVLVIGATGYIGSRLVPALLAAGVEVSVLARNPHKLDGVPWSARVSVHEGGLGDDAELTAAMGGKDVVCHLVHSMGTSDDFEREERRTAETFVRAAEMAGVGRIVHLSGLHPDRDDDLSPHLRSRVEVGRILLDSTVPALVLQAGVVVGSGSASFEMIRHLTTRLPAMITPKWVHNRIQPIAIRDVVHYLVAASTCETDGARTIDVGGPDVLEYGEMMQQYAEEAGLHRRISVPVPLLTPRLSSLWVKLVTPLPGDLAAPLVESLRCEAIVSRDDADELLGPPPGGRTGYREAVREALRVPIGKGRPARWEDSDPVADPAVQIPTDADWAGVRPPTIWRAASGAR